MQDLRGIEDNKRPRGCSCCSIVGGGLVGISEAFNTIGKFLKKSRGLKDPELAMSKQFDPIRSAIKTGTWRRNSRSYQWSS
jgi:hypothetical protein